MRPGSKFTAVEAIFLDSYAANLVNWVSQRVALLPHCVDITGSGLPLVRRVKPAAITIALDRHKVEVKVNECLCVVQRRRDVRSGEVARAEDNAIVLVCCQNKGKKKRRV